MEITSRQINFDSLRMVSITKFTVDSTHVIEIELLSKTAA